MRNTVALKKNPSGSRLLMRILLWAFLISFSSQVEADLLDIMNEMDEEFKICPTNMGDDERLKCIEVLRNQKRRRAEEVYQALKESRKYVNFDYESLPDFNDSEKEATKKISGLCLLSSSHCGYFSGLYVKEMGLLTKEGFFGRRYNGFSMYFELNDQVLRFLETSFNLDNKAINCIDIIRTTFPKPKRSVLDGCTIKLEARGGFNREVNYFANWNGLGFYHSKPKK